MAESESTNFFTNPLYDKLKFIALVILPALGTLYFTVAALWGLPHTTEVVGTITAIDTFLGLVLQGTSRAYYKNGDNFDGTLFVQETNESPLLALEMSPESAQDIPGKHSVEFNVTKVAEAKK